MFLSLQITVNIFNSVNHTTSVIGMNTGASLLEGKTDDWGIVFDINVIGTCTVTREIINLMREAVSSSWIFVFYDMFTRCDSNSDRDCAKTLSVLFVVIE